MDCVSEARESALTAQPAAEVEQARADMNVAPVECAIVGSKTSNDKMGGETYAT
jgi:hypothetical protein